MPLLLTRVGGGGRLGKRFFAYLLMNGCPLEFWRMSCCTCAGPSSPNLEEVNHKVWTLLSWWFLPFKCLLSSTQCPVCVLPTTKVCVLGLSPESYQGTFLIVCPTSGVGAICSIAGCHWELGRGMDGVDMCADWVCIGQYPELLGYSRV